MKTGASKTSVTVCTSRNLMTQNTEPFGSGSQDTFWPGHSPRQRPQMSCFVHNPKIFSLLSEGSKETRKYSHLRGLNQRIMTFFLKKITQTD